MDQVGTDTQEHAHQDNSDSLTALRFLGEVWAVRSVNVRRMVATWENKTKREASSPREVMANIQCDSTDNADLKAEDTTKHAEDTAVLCERKESSSELGEEVSDVIRDGLGDVEDNTEQLPGCNDDLQMYAAGLTTQTVRTEADDLRPLNVHGEMDTQNFEDGALHKPKEGKARRTESPMYWKEWMDECGQVALLMAKLDWMRSGEDDDIGELMSMLRDLVEHSDAMESASSVVRTQSVAYLNESRCPHSEFPQYGHRFHPTSRSIRRSQSAVNLTEWERLKLDHCMDVVMEAAFPQSAICRLANHVVKENAELLASLESGEAYRKEGIFISGSRVEGLAMEDYWGHQSPDEDVMVLYGGRRAVFVPGGNRERGESCLIYRPEGCPSAYTNLEISDLMSLRNEWWWKEKCLHEDGDRQWLNTFNTVRCFKRGDPDDERITTGPSNESWGGARDIVATFVCSSPHPELVQDFKNKRLEGSWPPPHLIDYLLELPMLLVLVGHKPSDECPLQARLSWSVPEIKLFQELSENIRQGYIACKYVLKYRLKIYRLQKGASDGRSTVGSYHLKTAFLHFLEKRPPSLINSPFKLFLGILRELDMHLQAGRLPHYFLQRCDLLETVGDDERRIARQAIKDVLSDPLTALFTSAVLPWQMYGQVHPHDLIFHFRSVCTQPTGGRSWKELCYLLTRVDEWRHRRYNKQLE